MMITAVKDVKLDYIWLLGEDNYLADILSYNDLDKIADFFSNL